MLHPQHPEVFPESLSGTFRYIDLIVHKGKNPPNTFFAVGLFVKIVYGDIADL